VGDLSNPIGSWIPYILEPNLNPLMLVDYGAPQGTYAIDALATIEFIDLKFSGGALL